MVVVVVIEQPRVTSSTGSFRFSWTRLAQVKFRSKDSELRTSLPTSLPPFLPSEEEVVTQRTNKQFPDPIETDPPVRQTGWPQICSSRRVRCAVWSTCGAAVCLACRKNFLRIRKEESTCSGNRAPGVALYPNEKIAREVLSSPLLFSSRSRRLFNPAFDRIGKSSGPFSFFSRVEAFHLKEGKSRDACVRLPEDFSKLSIPVVSIVVLSPLPKFCSMVFSCSKGKWFFFFFFFGSESRDLPFRSEAVFDEAEREVSISMWRRRRNICEVLEAYLFRISNEFL